METEELVEAFEKLALDIQALNESVQAGRDVDATPLRNETNRLCAAITALPGTEARKAQPVMERAIGALDVLSASLKERF